METYRGGSTNQGLRRLLRKYAEGGPVMRSYEPSWRDRIGAYLFDQTSGSPVSRRAVEGLVGSTGLGNTGLSVADVVPGGQVLAAQEALREGDYKGAAMAVMPIPGASKLGPLARSAAPIKAYHSSPHDFDKFDLSKIGTGEGAQAYGHGLYMAENPAVSGRGGEYDKQFTQRMRAGADRSLAQYGGDVDAAEAAARAEIERLNDLPNKGGDPDRLASLIETQQDRLAALNIFKQTGEFPKSRIYEVNIHADPEHFLDWDKPMSKQSPAVRERLAALGVNDTENIPQLSNKLGGPLVMSERDIDGADAYSRIAERFRKPVDESVSVDGGPSGWGFVQNTFNDKVVDHQAASELLKNSGIPGIKYLDEGSRFHPANLPNNPIANEARKFLEVSGGDASKALTAFNASNPGERFVTTERNEVRKVIEAAARAQTKNYVVFDDRIISIAKKYGIPLAAASAIFEASNPRPAMASEAPVDRARGGAVQGYATGGPTDNSLEALYRKYAAPTMRQRTRKTVAGIDPERDRDQPVIDPATMGEEWNRARRNYQNFPRQEGEAVARPLELGARDRLAGYIAGGAREPGAQSRRSLADLLLGSTGLPDSGTLGVGVADLPMVTGIPLALADIVHDIGQGDYASTAMGAALPAAFYARGPLGAAGKRAVKIANDYAKPIAGAAGVAATMTPEDAEAAKLRVPAGVRQILSGTPENADHIAFLLRNGRGTEVTNALANTADPITLLRHYLSGGTGAEMPMGRAARIGRAKEGGYHTEKPYYHAGDPKTAFDNSRGELYATTDKSFAKAYRADKNYGDVRSLLSRHQNTIEGDDVIDFFHNKVSSRNPSGVNIKYGWQAFDPDHLAGVGGDPRDASKLLPALKKEGFDSAFFPEDFPPTSSYTDPSSSRAFFYPETLRDISARFDPRLSHVSNLDYAQGGEVKNYARGGSVEGYAEGGPVSSAAIYDPAEIDALAASIIEGNYA